MEAFGVARSLSEIFMFRSFVLFTATFLVASTLQPVVWADESKPPPLKEALGHVPESYSTMIVIHELREALMAVLDADHLGRLATLSLLDGTGLNALSGVFYATTQAKRSLEQTQLYWPRSVVVAAPPEGLELLRSRRSTGKVVLTMRNEDAS